MMNLEFERKLTIPKDVKEMYPVSPELSEIVAERAKEIEDIFTGKDRRLIPIIGPCSADHEDSVIDYISRLIPVQEQVKEKELLPLPVLVQFTAHPDLLFVSFIPFFPDGRDLATCRRPVFCCLIQTIRSRELGSSLNGEFGEGESKFIPW